MNITSCILYALNSHVELLKTVYIHVETLVVVLALVKVMGVSREPGETPLSQRGGVPLVIR